MVRPHLEFANSMWFLYKKGDIEIIEKVVGTKRYHTKLIIYLKHLSYTERLKQQYSWSGAWPGEYLNA